jgi:hypothetical protein
LASILVGWVIVTALGQASAAMPALEMATDRSLGPIEAPSP